MGKALSLDLRERIVDYVERGGSRRGAAAQFRVSPSCAIKLVARYQETGSAAPGRRGGSAGKLAAHKDFLLARIAEEPDITMPELAAALEAATGTTAAPASLSRFLIRHGWSYKKNAARQRARARRRPPAA